MKIGTEMKAKKEEIHFTLIIDLNLENRSH